MSHQCLTDLRAADPPIFYLMALKYGQYLWLKGHAGRALLAVTRALYADVPDADPVLEQWPLPYAALQWIVAHHDSDDFPGNPAVSFQHQATRLRGDRRALRRARAWAVWALVKKTRPGLPDDPLAADPLPAPDVIERKLQRHGHPQEAREWRAVLDAAHA